VRLRLTPPACPVQRRRELIGGPIVGRVLLEHLPKLDNGGARVVLGIKSMEAALHQIALGLCLPGARDEDEEGGGDRDDPSHVHRQGLYLRPLKERAVS
jgi:hypothetical protein